MSKLVTDNAFSKAWKKDCPTCKNTRLWFRDKCHECETKELETAKEFIQHIEKCKKEMQQSGKIWSWNV